MCRISQSVTVEIRRLPIGGELTSEQQQFPREARDINSYFSLLRHEGEAEAHERPFGFAFDFVDVGEVA
jgi:hypothetical protein